MKTKLQVLLVGGHFVRCTYESDSPILTEYRDLLDKVLVGTHDCKVMQFGDEGDYSAFRCEAVVGYQLYPANDDAQNAEHERLQLMREVVDAVKQMNTDGEEWKGDG